MAIKREPRTGKKSARVPRKAVRTVSRHTSSLSTRPKAKTEKGKQKVARKIKAAPRKVSIAARLTLEKHEHNPILAPQSHREWECDQTFNPSAVLLDHDVHFVYRAIGRDGLSRIGYAMSHDGLKIDERSPNPVYEHQVISRAFNTYSYYSGGSWGGAEDPRIVRVDNENRLYMTYTACNGDLRVALTSIALKDFLKKKFTWKPPVLISPPGEVHKNWVIFPEKINGKYAMLHSINPEVQIEYLDNLDFDDEKYIASTHGGEPRKQCWDKWVRGVGPVPIKTKYGWLVFYHAMDNDWGKYKVGAIILDLKDPTRVIARARKPVLEPSEYYENNGFKGGVIYVSGAVIKDGRLFVYYGGADSYVCAATADADDFLDKLISAKEPRLHTVRGKK